MEEELKLKSSKPLVVVRTMVWIILIAIIACGFFSLVDLGLVNENPLDERAELVSSGAFQCGVEALQWFEDHQLPYCDIQIVTSVSFLKHGDRYVLIKYKNSFNEDWEACYSATQGRGYDDGYKYHQAKAALGAYNNFVGQEGESPTRTFTGEELAIMFEEGNIHGFDYLQ